jgi:SAM-dependent methyltransferase
MSATGWDPEGAALLALLQALAARDYRFVTPTPATHARVVGRAGRERARDLRDVLGWSLPFEPEVVEPALLDLLRQAGALSEGPQGLKSRYRVSPLGERLFVHSAYPTEAEDAVFFGPDSYRFARFVIAEIAGAGGRMVDVGAGAGVGAIVAAGLAQFTKVVMADINPKALRLARVNAAFAGVEGETVETEGLEGLDRSWDLVLANPPYIADAAGREYRDGGDMHGGRLSVELAKAAAERLAPGGRLLLYTGAAIVEGRDALHEALEPALRERGCTVRYRELDPDVFGEELEKPPYRDVERIAVVAAVAVKAR